MSNKYRIFSYIILFVLSIHSVRSFAAYNSSYTYMACYESMLTSCPSALPTATTGKYQGCSKVYYIISGSTCENPICPDIRESYNVSVGQCTDNDPANCGVNQIQFLGQCVDTVDCGDGRLALDSVSNCDTEVTCPAGEYLYLGQCYKQDGPVPSSSSASSVSSESSSDSSDSQSSVGNESSSGSSSSGESGSQGSNSSTGTNSSTGSNSSFDDSRIVDRLDDANDKLDDINEALNGTPGSVSKGSFDNSVPQQKIAELTSEYEQTINQIKAEAATVLDLGFGSEVGGSCGSLVDNVITTQWGDITFGWSRFCSELSIIPISIIFCAYVMAAFIILRN